MSALPPLLEKEWSYLGHRETDANDRSEHWLASRKGPLLLQDPFSVLASPIRCLALSLGAKHEAAQIHAAIAGAVAWPLAARAQQPEE
jgi:hypothetical protein